MRMLCRDRNALEGLPLKLLITSLVISLCAPALNGALSYLEYSTDVAWGTEQAEKVRASALSAFVGGSGNVRTIVLELGSGDMDPTLRLGGGEDDPGSSLIEVLWRGRVAATVALESPAFRILTSDGMPVLIEGHVSVRLLCVETGRGLAVLAEVG